MIQSGVIWNWNLFRWPSSLLSCPLHELASYEFPSDVGTFRTNENDQIWMSPTFSVQVQVSSQCELHNSRLLSSLMHYDILNLKIFEISGRSGAVCVTLILHFKIKSVHLSKAKRHFKHGESVFHNNSCIFQINTFFFFFCPSQHSITPLSWNIIIKMLFFFTKSYCWISAWIHYTSFSTTGLW